MSSAGEYNIRTSSGRIIHLSEEWYKKIRMFSISDTGSQILYTDRKTSKQVQLARLIANENRPDYFVHYKDGDRYNLRPENLYSDQVKQGPKSKAAYEISYGKRLKGVTKGKKCGYTAQISVYNGAIYLYSPEEHEAALKHDAMIRLFGLHGIINFPDEVYTLSAEDRKRAVERWNMLYNRELEKGKNYDYGKLLEV